VRAFYDISVRDGTTKTVFFDGSIHSRDMFLETVKAPSNIVCFFFRGRSEVPEAFAWLNALGGHTAFAHFSILKSAWGGAALEFGRMALDYWFSFNRADGSPLLHLILGTIPSVNRRAIRYVKALGFRSCGAIPNLVAGRNGLCAGDLVYYPRD
jgi:RimJ/RimL family protein N-acetyltransferase